MADFSTETFAKLQLKNLAEHKEPSMPSDSALQVGEEDVFRTIRSFLAGSSVVRMASNLNYFWRWYSPIRRVPVCSQPSHRSQTFSWRGNVTPRYQSILYGGRLIALNKKLGGIRSIVVGYFWRRLAAKCACSYATSKLAEFFTPVHVRVGIPGGCEAAVHAIWWFIKNMGADGVQVKLDFANSFNCLHRDHMLNIVKKVIQEIYYFYYSA